MVPVGDLIVHEINDGCPCGPRPVPRMRPDGSAGWVLVHHSLDGREFQESEQ